MPPARMGSGVILLVHLFHELGEKSGAFQIF